ncbi:MAG: hypothetical protein ACREFY_17845 [Acetobacteraceae bacterium]
MAKIVEEHDRRVALQTGGPGQLIGWANRFGDSRTKIVQQLISMYSRTNSLVLTSAFVDFSRWLGIAPDDWAEPSSLTDQIAVAAALTRAWACGSPDGSGTIRKALVSYYAPFDPARAVLPGSDGDPISLLDAALAKGEIIGVKLYPPMGFRATANSDPSLQFPALIDDHPMAGAALDAALDRMYRVCLKHDAPLMSHCGDSNYTDPAYGKRAGPQYWLSLINTKPYRNLRVNLGHFGSIWAFWEINSSDKDTAEKQKRLGAGRLAFRGL